MEKRSVCLLGVVNVKRGQQWCGEVTSVWRGFCMQPVALNTDTDLFSVGCIGSAIVEPSLLPSKYPVHLEKCGQVEALSRKCVC